jgi:hypothetical protein
MGIFQIASDPNAFTGLLRSGRLALRRLFMSDRSFEIGDKVFYHGLTYHVVDTAGCVIGICSVPNPKNTARVMWVSPTRVTKIPN